MSNYNSQISENGGFFGSISATVSPFKNLLQKSKQKSISIRRLKTRSDGENVAPIDPNIQISDPPLCASTSFPKKSPSKPKIDPCKEELVTSVVREIGSEAADPPVKVVVRIGPDNALGIGDRSVKKISKDSLSIADRKYTFDSVLDSNSTQGDVYAAVGAPLVKDALTGYNTSILAYGQTGSGKTHTMWGHPSAMVEDPSLSGSQGIVPRIFENLFLEIQKEQDNSDGKQLNYQCRCSFLEVYGDKIADLLDPTQRNLEIKDDSKHGFYIENLTEEYVTSYEDVTHQLIKGLSNRKMGATSINSKSSRSHILFTCIIESWCKESSSNCFGSSKTSRISLVDLAGFEGNALDDASGQQKKEGKYIKKSTSKLGRLVNILAEGSHSEISEDPYSSPLTHLLRESFGGNAKLAILCAISPHKKHNSETLSTLRFGTRAKLMKNEPVINEITEDDVNNLSDQIQQLKEELIRAKSSTCNSLNNNPGYFSGQNVRQSLNHLRLSLNRSLLLPVMENDSEEKSCINEDAVKELKLHIDENLIEESENGENTLLYSAEGCETEVTCEHYLSCSEESESEEVKSSKIRIEESEPEPEFFSNDPIAIDDDLPPLMMSALPDPMLSESPKIKNTGRKSVVFASNHFPNHDDFLEASKNLDVLRQSCQQLGHIRSSLRSSRMNPGPSDSLAASLHRGLQIIDYHQKNSAPSTVSFSFEHLAIKPDSSVQTLPTDDTLSSVPKADSFLCTKCQGREMENFDGLESQSSKVGQDIETDIQIEKLGTTCKEQAAEIERLNQLLEQYKCETNQTVMSSISNSSNFSDMKNQLPINQDEQEKKSPSLNGENKLLTWKSDENHALETIKDDCEIKEVQIELNHKEANSSFTAEERESLLSEIEILRNKLQFYTAPTRRSTDLLRTSLLSQSIQLRKSFTHTQQGNNGEELEKERQQWMEMESDWISLTDELRIEIESNRLRAEQVEMELRLEKKCTEELDDVLKRSILGHAKMIEHYADLQEKYNELVGKHRAVMEGVAEVKRAVAKAGGKKGRNGTKFAKALSAELSALRVEREREREMLKKENRSLKVQLKDTVEAVHAAGEVLVRLKEAEEAAAVAEEKNTTIQEENDKLKKQVEKIKRKHKMEMITMKEYLAGSRLPEAALRPPLYRNDSDVAHHDNNNNNNTADTFHDDDDQAWRAEFGAIYQEHY